MKLITILLMSMFLISFSLAEDYNSIKFNPGDLVNITGIKCIEKNNSICRPTYNCTISVIDDLQVFIASNSTMIDLPDGFKNYNLGYAPNYKIVVNVFFVGL